LFWREVPDGGVHLVGLKVFLRTERR